MRGGRTDGALHALRCHRDSRAGPGGLGGVCKGGRANGLRPGPHARLSPELRGCRPSRWRRCCPGKSLSGLLFRTLSAFIRSPSGQALPQGGQRVPRPARGRPLPLSATSMLNLGSDPQLGPRAAMAGMLTPTPAFVLGAVQTTQGTRLPRPCCPRSRRMRVLCGCGYLRMLWAALAVSMTLGFTIQLLGISFQKRVFSSRLLPVPLAPPAKPEEAGGKGLSSQTPLCQPHKHLVFLKTHKTGSSTIVNILHRFGDSRGLQFALPARYQFSYPNPFLARRVKGWHPKGHLFDILCHHMRFNLPEVQRVVHSDSFYFSIVRDPVSLAESAFSYYRGVVPAFSRAGTLLEFLASPHHFYRPGERGNHYARNLLWFDFGLDPLASQTPALIQATLVQLERIFHFVLLTEHMDESLVLLRHALCWTLDDVVAFRHNLRSPESVYMLDPSNAARLRAWNNLDWHLYTHFNRTFWARVERFGYARMAQEMAMLQKRRAELMQHCLQGGGPLEPGDIADEHMRPFQFGQAPILGYALQPSLAPGEQEVCQRMVTPELQYKDLLDAKQFPAPRRVR